MQWSYLGLGPNYTMVIRHLSANIGTVHEMWQLRYLVRLLSIRHDWLIIKPWNLFVQNLSKCNRTSLIFGWSTQSNEIA